MNILGFYPYNRIIVSTPTLESRWRNGHWTCYNDFSFDLISLLILSIQIRESFDMGTTEKRKPSRPHVCSFPQVKSYPMRIFSMLGVMVALLSSVLFSSMLGRSICSSSTYQHTAQQGFWVSERQPCNDSLFLHIQVQVRAPAQRSFKIHCAERNSFKFIWKTWYYLSKLKIRSRSALQFPWACR